MHNPICLHTSVPSIGEKQNQEPFRLSFPLEQMKPIKVLSRLVPHLFASLPQTTIRFRQL